MTEKQPQFLREFSKEESPDERTKTAREIKSKRKGRAERLKADTEREHAMSEQLRETQELEKTVEEISRTLPDRILNYFQLRKLRAEIAVGKQAYEELKSQRPKMITKYDFAADGTFVERQIEDVPDELQEAEAVVSNFYQNQKEKWAKSEYAADEVEKYFSEEHLSSLSVEEYALLLRRFSGKMVAHVTRQGVRDHTGMIFHTGGAGEYSNGFMNILEDGRLRSPLGVQLVEKEKEKALEKYLHLDSFKTREEALEHLHEITSPNKQGEPGSYADRMAVHFATEEVADNLYGSEKGNEIFFAYPSDYVASQYYFNGQLADQDGGYWNDQWVWANEERGMALNAGLVFIPEEAKVDRKTGSRYELDENRKPVENEKYKKIIKDFINSPDFTDFANKVKEEFLRSVTDWRYREEEMKERLAPFKEKLEKDFGFKDERLKSALMDYERISSALAIKLHNEETGEEDSTKTIDGIIMAMLKSQGIFYKEAEDTTSSKEFWEDYFAQNPDKKPNKVVFYKGQDPTKALKEWRDKNDIGGFGDKKVGLTIGRVERSSPKAMVGMDRFESLATKVIDDYYAHAL